MSPRIMSLAPLLLFACKAPGDVNARSATADAAATPAEPNEDANDDGLVVPGDGTADNAGVAPAPKPRVILPSPIQPPAEVDPVREVGNETPG